MGVLYLTADRPTLTTFSGVDEAMEGFRFKLKPPMPKIARRFLPKGRARRWADPAGMLAGLEGSRYYVRDRAALGAYLEGVEDAQLEGLGKAVKKVGKFVKKNAKVIGAAALVAGAIYAGPAIAAKLAAKKGLAAAVKAGGKFVAQKVAKPLLEKKVESMVNPQQADYPQTVGLPDIQPEPGAPPPGQDPMNTGAGVTGAEKPGAEKPGFLSGLPSWALPVGIGAAALLLVMSMKK